MSASCGRLGNNFRCSVRAFCAYVDNQIVVFWGLEFTFLLLFVKEVIGLSYLETEADMWAAIAVVIWILGCAVCSLFIDFLWKTAPDFDIVEVAAIISLWPVFVSMIVLFVVGISLFGWWILSKRMFRYFVRTCRAFDLGVDN